MRGTRGELTWHDADIWQHHGSHVGPRGRLRGAKELSYVHWAHGNSGPKRLKGGCSKAH